MFNYSTIFLLVAGIVADESSAVVDKKYNCALTYANQHFEFEENFKILLPNDTHLTFNASECDKLVDEIREESYADFTELYSGDAKYSSHVDCILNKLKEFMVGDFKVLEYVYQHDTKMPKLFKVDAVWEVEFFIGQKTDLAEELCMPAEVIGDYFDQWYGSHDVNATAVTEIEENDVIEDLEEAYCWKNHLVATNFSGIASYNITVNVKNIDKVSDEKCAKYWRYSEVSKLTAIEYQILSAVKSYNGQQKDCVYDAIKKGQFTEMQYKALALGEAKLSEDAKMYERELFIDHFTHLNLKMLSCFA